MNENKNPIVVEVNDTPVLVETKEKRNHTDAVISLGGANQVNENKNPVMENNIDDVMENEVNDTPVTVETKNEIMKVRKCSVVQIPKGKTSPSLSSIIPEKDPQKQTGPDIYKKRNLFPPDRATNCDKRWKEKERRRGR